MRYLHLVVAVAWLCAAAFVATPAAAGEYATKDEAVALVKQAIGRVAEVGMDKAKPEFMDHGGKFVDRDLYLIQGNRIWNSLDNSGPGIARLGPNRFYPRVADHHRRRRWMASRPALRAWRIRGQATPDGTICLRC
jgi:hypothetical protein